MRGNLGCFEAIWLFIWNLIKNSGCAKLLRRIYNAISGAYKKSAIAGYFRKLHFSGEVLCQSVFGRAVRCPFTFIEFLQKKTGQALKSGIEKSRIIRLCRIYLGNILALNTRFIGIMLVFSSAGIAIGQSLSGGTVGFVIIGAGIIGALLAIFDVNFTQYFKASFIVRLFCKILDIEADFNWFEEEYTKGKLRYFTAGAAGFIFGLAGGIINPLILPLAIIGLAGLFLIIKKPSAGVFALIFIAPLAPTMVSVGLSLLCLFSMIVHALLTDGFKFKFDGIGFCILLFIAVYLIAGITSFAPLKSLSIWAIYFVFMTMYFVIINSVNTQKLLGGLLTIFVLSGFLVCLYGIAQYLFGWDISQAWIDEEMFEDIKMRIYSTLGNPNVLGEYILLVLPVAIGLMWVKKSAVSKIAYAVISAVMFGALILTFSRGCWIGLIFAAAIFITIVAGKLWGLGLIALPVIPMILPQSIINRFSSIGDMTDSSTSYRVYIWMGTLAMVKDFWVSGIGMGQEAFTQVYPFYSYNGIVAPHSHNLFLQILVESGVIGIIVFAAIVFFFLRRIMVGYQYGGRGDSLSTVMTAVAAGVCGFLVQGMFDNSFYNYRVMLIFWCTLAMGRACVYVAKQRRQACDTSN